MKYPHILAAFAATPWALQPAKLAAIVEFLVMQAHGVKFERPEIEARITQQRARETAGQTGAVAILPVHGVLSQRMDMMGDISGGTSTDALAAAFQALMTDDRVKAIVLDVDSPGGSVFGIQEFAQTIFDSRGSKPVVAQVNSIAASAAYWIAAQADEIVVTPSGEAGSIGVCTVHDDISAALEQAGIKRTMISDGEHKGERANFKPLSDEARADLEGRVKDYGDQFRGDVARGRNVSVKAVREGFGGGRMFGARALLERGMADRIATLSDTLSRFDGAPARPRGAAAMMATRAAFAGGGIPKIQTLEALLCEAGASKTQAKAIVGHGLPYLARCEAEDATKDTHEAFRALLRTPFGKLTRG